MLIYKERQRGGRVREREKGTERVGERGNEVEKKRGGEAEEREKASE